MGDPRIWDRGGETVERGVATGLGHGLGVPAGLRTDRSRGWTRTDTLTPRVRGRGSSCDMRPPTGDGRRTGKNLDAPEGSVATAGAKARALGQQIEDVPHFPVGSRYPLAGRVDLAEREAAAGQEAGPTGMGQEPIVTNADEALGEDVEEEAAAKLSEGKGEGPGSLATVVLVAKGDGLVIDGHEPMIRDRDTVGVAGQIPEHMFGRFEGGLGKDDPFGAACLLEKAVESC